MGLDENVVRGDAGGDAKLFGNTNKGFTEALDLLVIEEGREKSREGAVGAWGGDAVEGGDSVVKKAGLGE